MGLKAVATFYIPGITLYQDEIITKTGVEFIKTFCRNEEEIIAATKDANVIITVSTLQPFTRRVIENLTNCRHIASIGVGYEDVDLSAATERDIAVTSTPYYCLEEVSDHTMALILALTRKILRLDKMVKKGKWGIDPAVLRSILTPTQKLKGQTLRLIGFGNIPRILVPKARGFGLRIIAYDPYVPEEIMMAHFGVEKVELEKLLRQSDIVSIHTALTKETKKMLKREHFKMMKPTTYFINTARGAIVDADALVEALQNGWIAGAGLDVTDPEPIRPDSPLLKMDNVVITAHTAHYSETSQRDLWLIPLEEAALTLQGKFPRFAVNPQIKERWLKRWAR